MKNITLEEWQKKYIAGSINNFSQKNISLSRFRWDPEMKMEGYKDKHFEMESEIKDQPGLSLQDQAMRFSANLGLMLDIFNTSRPNPPQVCNMVEETIASSGYGLPSYIWQRPQGVELDISDLQKVTRDIKKVAISFGADLVGVCHLDRRWIYSHTFPPLMYGRDQVATPQEVSEEYQYAIVTAYEMDYDMLKYFHTHLAEAAIGLGYSRMAFTNMLLTKFIKHLGYKAINCATNDVALSVPMAMQAGLGELGRGGWIITPEYGPRVRLTMVLTDLPLVPDSPIDFGVTDFCEACMKCAEMCPSQSISYDRRSEEVPNISSSAGALKWPINGETCAGYWVKTHKGCCHCLAVCPYNKVNTWPHRLVRWFTDNVRWLDSVYVKLDNLFSYGKIKSARNFWKEWKPNPYGRSK
jgi:reductive dehalogenase